MSIFASFNPSSLENLQQFLFPLVILFLTLLSFRGIPILKARRIRIPVPGVILIAALGLWLFSFLHLRGYIPIKLYRDVVYWARLDGDFQNDLQKDYVRRYNQRSARVRGLKARVLEQEIKTEDGARAWLENHQNALFVIWGDKNWPLVTARLVPQLAKEKIAIPEAIKSEAEKLNLSLEEGIIPVPSYEEGPIFLVPTRLPSFSLPLASPDLAMKYLVEFAQGLSFREHRKEIHTYTFSRELQRAQLLAAAGFEGPWKSATPQAATLNLAGTMELLDTAPRHLRERGQLICSAQLFQHAKNKARAEYEPELTSIIYNNVALAEILGATKASDFRHAKRWLLQGASLTDRNGEPTVGAKLSLINLITLERSGLG